ncbi:lysosomal alpha-mannosidase II isoform X3 [Lycorma delicatula]|uniref:lysosomal alpha-mannosidase II isoform X3 n=1 Tax=Lycorma delicatula TaxID=130591 RepID=UPI003F50E7EB
MRKIFLFIFLFCLYSGVANTPISPDTVTDETVISCGYETCPPTKPGMLNVHLVPHTHDDVGWLKTVDQYYYGSRSTIAKAGVQYILDSVVEELLQDESRRFIYVETAYFWKWWKEQSDFQKHKIRKLVRNGQLEFIGGAWSMNDEADTNYQSVIDQFTWGFRKLNDSFGRCGRPRIGWQIDPFGHSRETASIMARLGFDGLFLGRIDYQDKQNRFTQKRTEMLWQGSPHNLGLSADIFTGILYNTYSPPPGFCFDILCDDEPIIDDKNSFAYNLDSRVSKFLEYIHQQKISYTTNHLIVTMGDDFNYQNANVWFKNMDKLIRAINEMQINGSNVNLLYSTPSCYLKALFESNVTLSVKSDDFLPYASDPHSYWTGYFTSRPTIKYFERKGNNFLQVSKQLCAMTNIENVKLNSLKSAMGVMQHHDAITGTEKQQVAFDYARLLDNAISETEIVTGTALRKLIEKQQEAPKVTKQTFAIETCPLLNISQCEITDTYDSFVVTLYNPLSYPVTKNVRIPVPGSKPNYIILCPMGKEQVSQVVPVPEAVQNIPGRFSEAQFELVFRANNLPPLGFRSYYIYVSNNVSMNRSYMSHSLEEKKIKIGNPNRLSFMVNNDENTLILTINKTTQFHLNQNFYYYKGAVGNNEIFANRSSGAYIFRPNGSEPVGSAVKMTTYKGPLVDEIHQTFSDWVTQIIRVYKNEGHVEFNWIIGPIPIGDGIGKEIISRYTTTTVNSKHVFYTDSNGREMMERIRNYRPTWGLVLEEPIAGNYYPVTSKITIKDDLIQLSVLTDRAQGGSSLIDGQIELMIHRRLLHDDAFGVGEALNETAFGKGLVVRGTHYLTAGSVKNQNAYERLLAQQKLLDIWTFFTPTPSISFDEYKNTYNMEYSGLREALPQNVHILTLEPWRTGSILIRLEHIFEVNEDPVLSNPATVDLSKLFFPFNITSLRETNLGANLYVDELKRMQWKSESNSVYETRNNDFPGLFYSLPSISSITLQPMQIRTFIIEVQY